MVNKLVNKPMKKLKYNYIYKTTNLINNKIYIGVHSTNNLNDGYLGSGKLLNRSINVHGKENFKKEILRQYPTSEIAYKVENKIVNLKFVKDQNTYNTKIGGDGGWDHLRETFLTKDENGTFYRKLISESNGKDTLFTAKDKDGNTFSTFKEDPLLLTGELCGISKDKVTVKDKDGNTSQVSVNDSRYKSGELVGVQTGLVIVKDKNGNTSSVSVNDPRYLSGELVGIMKGKINVKDKDGNITKVSVNDPRYLSGELVGIQTGFVSVKDKNGNTSSVSVNDPRYLSGELVHISKGLTIYKDKDGNFIQTFRKDPRVISGELVGAMKGRIHKQVTCPWCGKTGGAGGIKSNHFDYCKENPNRKLKKTI